MSVKKSVVVLYFEFYQPQDISGLEQNLRRLSKKKKFPPFRKLVTMINYKNMRGLKDNKILINPPIILPDVNELEQK